MMNPSAYDKFSIFSADKQGRLLAFLGLAANYSQSSGNCPSDEEFADFIDRQLDKENHRRLLVHFNHCPQCRYQLGLVASHIYAEPKSIGFLQSLQLARKLFQKRLTSLLKRCYSETATIFINGIRQPAYSLSALICLLSVWLLWSNGLDQQLDEQIAIVQSRNSSEELNNILTGLKEWHDYGFDPAANYSALSFSKQSASSLENRTSQALNAGLWSSLARLRGTAQIELPDHLILPNQQSWNDSEWNEYYHLGQWIALLAAELQITSYLPNWRRYEAAFADLHDRLSTQKNFPDELANDLESIKTHLAQLPVEEQLSKRLTIQVQLLRSLQKTVQYPAIGS